jgi:alginate O-acetyltransferase complex protein AlgI
VFFRANDLNASVHYLASMIGLGHHEASATLLPGLIYKPFYLIAFGIASVAVWFLPDTWEWTQTMSRRKAICCAAIFVLSIVVLVTQEYNPFIYFIF